VLELEAIGPAPFCAMMLADMGADVLRIDRPGDPGLGVARERWSDVLARGRRSVTVDLKQPSGVDAVLALAQRADVLVEGFRPGVLERLGLSAETLLARNPRLVVGRMTGWGQEGPLADRAGHDIDYIALSGALHAIGRAGERPVPPLNLVGDFGGGGMLLAFGVVCALHEAQRGRRDRAQVLRGAARKARAGCGLAAGAIRPWRLDHAAITLRRRVRHPHARRMDARVRRQRCVRGTGADVRRGGDASA
jgi:alpha-methylacyl-CoA racemase